MSKAFLSQLENSKSERPSADVLYKIATALGTSIADLLGKRVTVASRSNQTEDIPENLKKAALQYGIPDDYVKRLALVSHRTDQKKSRNDYAVNDWYYLYQTLSRVDQSKQ